MTYREDRNNPEGSKRVDDPTRLKDRMEDNVPPDIRCEQCSLSIFAIFRYSACDFSLRFPTTGFFEFRNVPLQFRVFRYNPYSQGATYICNKALCYHHYPAKRFNCPANCAVFSVAGCHIPITPYIKHKRVPRLFFVMGSLFDKYSNCFIYWIFCRCMSLGVAMRFTYCQCHFPSTVTFSYTVTTLKFIILSNLLFSI